MGGARRGGPGIQDKKKEEERDGGGTKRLMSQKKNELGNEEKGATGIQTTTPTKHGLIAGETLSLGGILYF